MEGMASSSPFLFFHFTRALSSELIITSGCLLPANTSSARLLLVRNSFVCLLIDACLTLLVTTSASFSSMYSRSSKSMATLLALNSEPAVNHLFSCCERLSFNVRPSLYLFVKFSAFFSFLILLQHASHEISCIARGQVERSWETLVRR
jgi:hypothetical protein